MIDKLRSIAIFATVVDQGTFRAAALHLGLAPSRVSEAVSDLEKNLGVTLLYRSTRQLSLTHEGRVLHESALGMRRAIETGLDAINPLADDPRGTLSVTMPAFVSQTGLMDAIAGFAKKYPGVGLEFDFSDRRTDLISGGFDVAIRAGWLEDSDLLSRKIGNADRSLVASPDYVATHAVPERPEDLEDWDWIRFFSRNAPTEFTSADGEVVTVTGRSRIEVNSADSLFAFATRGLGVTAIPENLANRGFSRGELVEVMPGWSLRQLGLYAVWADRSRRENLTLMFVRYLAESDVRI